MEEKPSPPVASGLPLAEAATQLGISECTLRERIKRGQVRAIREIDRGHAVYRVFLEADPPPGKQSPPVAAVLPPPITSASPPAGELVQALALVDHLSRENGRLHEERAELFGRLGFYQARIQELERRVLELEAPKEALAEMSNQPAPGQGDQDPTGQAVSTEPKEQPQAEAASAPGMTSAANGQEANPGGTFRRFWRWLTQPI